jgi:hypothetical protein
MPSPETKKELSDLVTHSQTLDPQKKGTVIKQIDLFSDQQIQKLTNIFTTEKQQLQKIENKYHPQEVAIKKQYLDTLQTFEQSNLQKAIQMVEAKSENKEQELENILKELPKTQKRKSHKFIKFLILFFVLGGASLFLLYQLKIIQL